MDSDKYDLKSIILNIRKKTGLSRTESFVPLAWVGTTNFTCL